MSSINLSAVARDSGFQKRVEYYMVKGAAAVIAEAPATAGHATRVVYAKSVMAGTASVLHHALAVLCNGTNATNAASGDPSAVLDSDMEFAVNEYWNAMSGTETGV